MRPGHKSPAKCEEIEVRSLLRPVCCSSCGEAFYSHLNASDMHLCKSIYHVRLAATACAYITETDSGQKEPNAVNKTGVRVCVT